MANLHRMHQLGVTIVSGSDSGIPDVFFEDFPADVTVVVTEMGLSNYTALTSATSNAAKAAALTDTGVLAVGKRADLLAVAGNPLENIQDLTRTCFVAAKGKVAVS
jgi:imidazolonepropionase-like amidohydrolase